MGNGERKARLQEAANFEHGEGNLGESTRIREIEEYRKCRRSFASLKVQKNEQNTLRIFFYFYSSPSLCTQPFQLLLAYINPLLKFPAMQLLSSPYPHPPPSNQMCWPLLSLPFPLLSTPRCPQAEIIPVTHLN